MLACNIPIPLSCSTGVHLGILNEQSLIFIYIKVLKCFQANLTFDYRFQYFVHV